MQVSVPRQTVKLLFTAVLFMLSLGYMKKHEIEAILKILCVFLGSLLLLSVFNGKITIFMVMGALSITYIFVHYWEKRFLVKKQKAKSEIK